MNSEAIKDRDEVEERKIFKYLNNPESVRENPTGLSIYFAEKEVELVWYRPGLVRVLIDDRDDFDREPSTPAVIAEHEEVELDYFYSEEQVRVLGPEIEVRVQLDEFGLLFFDQAENLLQADFPGQAYGFNRGEVEFNKVLKSEERIYGLGEKTGFLDKRGKSYQMWNTDTFDPHVPSIDPLYISVPFYLSLAGGLSSGIYFDNSYRTEFDLGAEKEEILSIQAAGGRIDYYFIAADKARDVVKKYTWLTGRTPLPPLWSLGHHQSRYSYYPEERVYELADRFREEEIPCDVIHLDIHYMDDYRVFTWDEDKFPEPARMLTELGDAGFKVVNIVDPGVKKNSEYDVYRSGQINDFFCRYLDGELYTGDVWPGESVFPDFTEEDVRNWWRDLHQEMIEQGVQGFWNDMNEPAVFNENMTMDEMVEHKNDGDPGPHKRFHNLYGLFEAMATSQALEKFLAERPFVLSRAAFAGSQRYSAVWTGDNRSFWEHIELSIPMLTNMGISGLGFAGCDVGGFTGDSSGELLARWYQLAAFMPFFRNHTTIGSRGQEPWAFGEPYTSIIREYVELRYHFLPQIYKLFYEQSRTGLPVWRPLFFHYQDDEKTYNLSDQVLVGDNIMLAPVMRPDTRERLVYLPAGNWYDFWTGELYEGGKSHLYQAELDRLPLFIQAGSSFVTMEPVQYIAGSFNDLTLNIVLGEADFQFRDRIYEDDGISFEYQQEAYNLIEYEVSAVEDEIKVEFINQKLGYDSELNNLQIRIMNLDYDAVKVTFNGNLISANDYIYQGDDLIISLPYQEEGVLNISAL
ncbi:MAG: TIM-barrel domain-containing protein [Halarsenatibacteraceae bacterium]